MKWIPLFRLIRRTIAPDQVGSLVVIGFIIFGGWLLPARADIIIIVDTAVDVIANDGACSLREAITAANNNGNYFGCIGAGGGYDLIEFSIGGGTPVITIGTQLPIITGPIEINGGTNRVELKGDGAFAGLTISGAGAAGSIVRGLVLNNFYAGIYLLTTTNIVIGGNFIGTNAAGTTLGGATYGIHLFNSTAQIGGTNGLTAGGSCTGDCNLISGHESDTQATGVLLVGGSSATIRGNFIGTNASGTAALGNGYGIRIGNSIATIGSTTVGSGNLISGNDTGISIKVTEGLAVAGSVIQGNLIGTNTSGSAAIPNGTGVSIDLGNHNYPLAIGGAVAGAGNVISGNTGTGILMVSADRVTVFGNRIGTQANGLSALPNETWGVHLGSSTHENVIGGVGAGEGNIIANSLTADGVRIGINNYLNRVRGNSIRNNAGQGIYLLDDQNNTAFTPVINGIAPVFGTACPNCIIDVYSDAADEGGTFHGTAIANANGDWTFSGTVTGPFVTATATGPGPYPSVSESTSEFSVPVPIPECVMKSGFENGPATCE